MADARPTTDRRLNAYLERKDKRGDELMQIALKMLLRNDDFCLVMPAWLERLGLETSCVDGSGMEVHFKAAKQEAALEMAEDLKLADEEAFYNMQREYRIWKRQRAEELDAREAQARQQQSKEDRGQ